jgi:hypothetical protein
MSEDKQNDSRWNIFSLKEWVDLALTSLEQRIEQRFTSTIAEMHKIEKQNDDKHRDMNEIREQLKDQATTFIPKNEYDLKHEILDNKINSLSKIVYIGLGIWTLLSLLIAIVLLLIFKK